MWAVACGPYRRTGLGERRATGRGLAMDATTRSVRRWAMVGIVGGIATLVGGLTVQAVVVPRTYGRCGALDVPVGRRRLRRRDDPVCGLPRDGVRRAVGVPAQRTRRLRARCPDRARAGADRDGAARRRRGPLAVLGRAADGCGRAGHDRRGLRARNRAQCRRLRDPRGHHAARRAVGGLATTHTAGARGLDHAPPARRGNSVRRGGIGIYGGLFALLFLALYTQPVATRATLVPTGETLRT